MIKKLEGNWIELKHSREWWIRLDDGHTQEIDWWLAEVFADIRDRDRLTITVEIEDKQEGEQDVIKTV